MSGDVEVLRLGMGNNLPGVRVAQQVTREGRTQRILAYLRDHPEGVSEKQLKVLVSCDSSSLWMILGKLIREKRVKVSHTGYHRRNRKYHAVGVKKDAE